MMYLILYYVVIGVVLTLYSLLAIWGGLARRPRWPVRVAVLLVAIAAMIPLDGRDGILYLLVHTGLIVILISAFRFGWSPLWRKLRRRPDFERQGSSHLQVTLKDVFYATALLAAGFALARHAANRLDENVYSTLWWPIYVTAFWNPVVVILTALLIVPSRAQWERVYCGGIVRLACLVLLLVIVTVTFGFATSNDHYWQYLVSGIGGRLSPSGSLVVVVHFLLTTTALILWRVGFLSGMSADDEAALAERPVGTMGRSSSSKISVFVARALLCSLVAVGAPPLGFLYWKMATPPPIPPVSTVNQSGYNQLINIAESLEALEIPMEDDGFQELHVFAPKHLKPGMPFDQSRSVIDLPKFVPVDYERDTMFPGVRGLHNLARLYLALAEHEQRQGHTDEAIGIRFDTMRIGHIVACDGNSSHYLLGRIAEQLGRSPLRRMRGSLTAEQRRRVIHELEEFGGAIAPIDGFIEREQVWLMHVYGWRGRMFWLYEYYSGSWAQSVDHYREIDAWHRAQNRLLVVTLALDNFREEHAQLPENLDELVPKYMSRVPEDPFGDGPFVYRRVDKSRYVLYSVGYNGVDNGGVLVNPVGVPIVPVEGPDAVVRPMGGAQRDKSDFFLDQEEWEQGPQSTVTIPVQPAK